MSSLFGALTTAVSGLTSQSAAFGNISDNVANSTTVGYKRTDTDFTDYLTTSSQVTNDSGFVTGRPDYRNDVQGTISTSDNATALAISGSGFFTVTQASTDNTSTEVLGTQPQYTRDGNFSLDKNGYLVNDSGEALNGWLASTSPVTNATTGVTTYPIDQTTVKPIQISQTALPPTATSNVTLSANLPASPASSTSNFASQINVYDAKGTLHTVALNYTPALDSGGNVIANTWDVGVTAPDAVAASSSTGTGQAQLTFSSSGQLASVAGTIGSGSTTGETGKLALSLDFGDGAQTVNVGVGTIGGSDGLTQFAGTSYTLHSITQNGVPPGAFSSVTTQANGNIVVNYDNGQSKTVAQVPVTDFANPDALQKQDGQAYTITAQSGAALVKTSASGGAGQLVTNATEGSNVDIATEFTKLIVAQRAYSANTKMITTADDMLQQTIDMKR